MLQLYKEPLVEKVATALGACVYQRLRLWGATVAVGKHFGKVFLLAQEEQVQAQAQLHPVWKQM